MTGIALRLGRLFRASGRSLITAFDHGTTLRMSMSMSMSGPAPCKVLATSVDSGTDGVLLSAGIIWAKAQTR